jgi:hypothetical protein
VAADRGKLLGGCLRRSNATHMRQGGLDDCYFFVNLIVLTEGLI